MVTTWPQLLVETMSWSMILLQLGFVVISMPYVIMVSLEPCCAVLAFPSMTLGCLILPLAGYCHRRACPTPPGPTLRHKLAPHQGSTLEQILWLEMQVSQP